MECIKMDAEKMRHAVENFINGNKGDFRKEVEKFKKYEIVDLILYVEEYYSDDIFPLEFKRLLREYLKK
jgi:hypothetical protein